MMMNTCLYRMLFVTLGSLSALVSAPALAEVGGHVDADIDLGADAGSGGPGSGALTVGGGGRFGWRVAFGRMWLQPEVGGHVTSVGGAHIVRATGGTRLGGSGLVAGVIEPALFVHGGYGWLDLDAKHPAFAQKFAPQGPAFDVGFALDVVVVRYFRVGVQGAYNVVEATYDSLYEGPRVVPTKWISFGLHAGAAF